MHNVTRREWRRFGFGGPPEPWEHGVQRDLDRLATSYYLDILESRRLVCTTAAAIERHRAEELFTTATQHKHEIDYGLRHPATPAERMRVEDRLGSLMRIRLLMRELVSASRTADPAPEPLPAA